MKNKKAIGFGKFFVILVFVLFGLTLWFFSISDKRVNASIGTIELDKIDSSNLEFYFEDSLRLGYSESLKTLAESSFISNQKSCETTSTGEIILNNDCKPEISAIKTDFAEKIRNYADNSLKKINITKNVKCEFEESEIKNENLEIETRERIRCYSEEIKLNYSRKAEFFQYEIYNKFVLNDTSSKDELNDIISIYEKAKTCKNAECKIESKDWTLNEIKEQGNLLVFYLETSKQFPLEKENKKIEWKFAVEKQ